jgi:tRNA (mo5U34)-methyltransferase
MTMKSDSLSKREIQRRIDAIHWYHEFDFGGGLLARAKTPDAQSHRALWGFIAGELEKVDFARKTVLDIGCWDGYWSFYAERKGAAKVLATDETGQNWAGTAGFDLARELLKSSVEYDLHRSVYELMGLQRKFDIILCLGVYYHLLDPFYAFAQIRHCCEDGAIVVFEGDVIFGLPKTQHQSAAWYSSDVERAPRFVPDLATLRLLITATYFDISREAMFCPTTSRIIDDPPAEGVYRVLLVCRPIRGRNTCHEYRPPFGLHAYDVRSDLAPERWSSLYLGKVGDGGKDEEKSSADARSQSSIQRFLAGPHSAIAKAASTARSAAHAMHAGRAGRLFRRALRIFGIANAK